MGRGDNVHGPRLRDFCLIIITHEAWYQIICFGDRNYGGMRQNFYCDNFHVDVHLEFSFNCWILFSRNSDRNLGLRGSARKCTYVLVALRSSNEQLFWKSEQATYHVASRRTRRFLNRVWKFRRAWSTHSGAETSQHYLDSGCKCFIRR